MSKKILIVEDEEGMREALSEAFKNENFEVLVAEDGEVAWNLIQKNSETIDLILLDIILPKKSGFELLELIKSNENTKNLQILLCTNLDQPQDIQKALDFGVTNYLVKASYSLSEIIQKVKNMLA